MSTKATKPSHIGREITRTRELCGMKQETLVKMLGISQQNIFHIEQSEIIEVYLLQKVLVILGVSPEGTKNFSKKAVIH